MAHCDDFHKEFDRFANGTVQVGELPTWMHVRGKVVWFVYQGPYTGLGESMRTFIQNVYRSQAALIDGPMGDVYPCSPTDHAGPTAPKLSTVFWVPVRG
jgi:hypothetical protein